MPRTGAPPITGLMPTTGAAVARSASRTPGIARIVPTETTGFDGGTTTTSASAIAARTPGAGVERRQVRLHEPRGGQRGAVPDPPLLEVDLAAVGGDHVRLDLVVGHRQERHARRPPLGEAGRDLRQRQPGPEQLGPGQVGRQVQVAEREPLPAEAVRRQVVAGPPALVATAPALLLVHRTAERVHQRVEVGADADAVQPHVVARVRDDGDGARRGSRARRPRVKRAPPTPPDRTVTFMWTSSARGTR